MKAKLQFVTTTNAERKVKIGLFQEDNILVAIARDFVSFEEFNTTYSTAELDGIVRLVASTNYRFKVESDNGGQGKIENGPNTCNKRRCICD